MASGFRFNQGQLRANVINFDSRVRGTIGAVMEFGATSGEAQMKVQAPWTDRTSAARTGLNTAVFEDQLAWTLILAHAVNYGIYLETRKDFNGRYAVILPVLVDTGNRIMQALEALFNKVDG